MSFFGFITGSGLFEDYVGDVNLESGLFEDYASHILSEKPAHKEIQEKLAIYLKDFLGQYVRGDKEGFLQRAESEARRLSHAAEKIQTFGNQNRIGVDMLHTIGYVYSRQAARQELGTKFYLGVPFFVELYRSALHTWITRSIAIKAAFEEAPQLGRKIEKQFNHTVKIISLPLLEQNAYMNICWKLDAFDVDATLNNVCAMVLREKNASKEELKGRATALKILGEIFQNHTSSSRYRTSSQVVLFCHCGRRAVGRVADTNINIGRPYYTCSINKDEVGYCGYFVWLDKLIEALKQGEALESISMDEGGEI